MVLGVCQTQFDATHESFVDNRVNISCLHLSIKVISYHVAPQTRQFPCLTRVCPEKTPISVEFDGSSQPFFTVSEDPLISSDIHEFSLASLAKRIGLFFEWKLTATRRTHRMMILAAPQIDSARIFIL